MTQQQQFQSTVADEEAWQYEQMHTDAQYAQWCLEVNAKINEKLAEEKTLSCRGNSTSKEAWVFELNSMLWFHRNDQSLRVRPVNP